MRAALAASILGLGSIACAAPTYRAYAPAAPLTKYSPGDGLVMLTVQSATTAFTSSTSIDFTLVHTDLDFEVRYSGSVGVGAAVVEPGRYRLKEVRVARYRVPLPSDAEAFTVSSGRAVALAPIKVEADEEGELWARFLDEPANGRVRYATAYPANVWTKRPWTDLGPPSRAALALVRVVRHPFGSWSRSGYNGYSGGGGSGSSGSSGSRGSGSRMPR